MPTPTVLPRIMLMAEKVPSLPFEADKLNCGVRGKKLCSFEEETSVALDEVSSSESDFEGYKDFELLLLGEAIENVLGVARYVEFV
jgi:hypothetical protein